MTDSDLAERLARLEARVSALEAAGRAARTGADDRSGDGREPGEGRAGADADSGEIGYRGIARLAGEVSWTIRYTPAGVLELPEAPLVAVLAALGHPVRLGVVRRLLSGPATAQELQEAAGLSSTGQLYHHLRGLTAARVVEQDARRRYRIPATGVVPLLVILLASADIAGELR